MRENTELYILFSLEEIRGRNIQHFVKKKKSRNQILLTHNSNFYFGGSQCWTKESVTFQTPTLKDYLVT